MSLFRKIATLVSGEANAGVDKAIASNSIPYLTQELRNMEANQSQVGHLAAAAAANLVVAGEDLQKAQANIDHLTAEAKAAKDAGDMPTAQKFAQQAVDAKEHFTSLQATLTNALQASLQMDDNETKLKTQCDLLREKLHSLKDEEASTKQAEQANAAMRQVQSLTSETGHTDIDAMEDDMHRRHVAAQTEFNRTSAELPANQPDPLKNKAATDLLNSL